MPEIYIPPKTVEKLNGSHPKGTRHQAKIDICMPLLGNGIPPIAIEQTLIEKFPEASLNEIQGVIRWCIERNPTPSGYGKPNGHAPQYAPRPKQTAPTQPTRNHAEQCQWWLNGKKTTEDDLKETSPIIFKGTAKDELITFLETLYAPEEKINIVRKHIVRDGKASPQGAGKTSTRLEWCDYIRANGVPESEAGAWIRMNPCKDGSGAGGAITDADVTAWKFLLLESDTVEPETLIALLQHLKLPISAILKSGGKSIHAWVRLDCPDESQYAETAKTILELLEPFGIDKANKNPSRLSRLPSARRIIQAQRDGMQSLLYLNAKAKPVNQDTINELRERLMVPMADDRPMMVLTHKSLTRYDELYQNRGRLGVQIGFAEFDKDTGGFKPGQMTVIAAETNKGKSTLAINMVHGAITRGKGVALFTMEMDQEEIMDLIVANHCEVNRNCFNTGYFQDADFPKIQAKIDELSKLPLWIFDDAAMTVEEIAKRVTMLKKDNRIELVVIDYIQIVSPSDIRTPREQQVAEIARGIRILAKQVKLPFIVLSQLNDEGKLRESRVVGHEAHNVIQIDTDDEKTRMEMKVVKGRRIRKKDYELKYEPEYARVTMSKIPDDNQPETRQYQPD